jgi:hypothetical protein
MLLWVRLGIAFRAQLYLTAAVLEIAKVLRSLRERRHFDSLERFRLAIIQIGTLTVRRLPSRGANFVYRAQDILEPLRQRPFRPIVLELSGGDRIEVKHPDQLLVGDSAIVVGVGTAESGAASRFRIIGLVHVRSVDFEATAHSMEDANGTA